MRYEVRRLIGICLVWSAVADFFWHGIKDFMDRSGPLEPEAAAACVLLYAATTACIQRYFRGDWHWGCIIGSWGAGIFLHHCINAVFKNVPFAVSYVDVLVQTEMLAIAFVGFYSHWHWGPFYHPRPIDLQ